MSREKDTLEKIHQEVTNCSSCPLHKKRTKAVPGEGNPNAEIFFIGEGPGKNEDLEGRPFVGAAGKFLDEMLRSVNLERKDVFIGNVIKCRPPNNRDPENSEIETCKNYLYRQIKSIKPKIICTLGRFSLGLLLPGCSISQVHGSPKKLLFNSKSHSLHPIKSVILIPLYHPAVALYRGTMREILLEDFKKISKVLKQIKNQETVE